MPASHARRSTPWAQVRDYRHAITHAGTLAAVDANWIGTWAAATPAYPWQRDAGPRLARLYTSPARCGRRWSSFWPTSTGRAAACWGERGANLSATQVYRLVTRPPERLNTRVLAAACDALGCTPNDLIQVKVTEQQPAPKAAAAWHLPYDVLGCGPPRRVDVTGWS